MSKSGRCAHCLKLVERLTSDHVFPQSWYPETTPPNLERWQMPACGPCNAKFGRIEERLLIRFGLCLDREDPRSRGIPNKALRALSPRHAKSEKDRRMRAALQKRILGSLVPRNAAPSRTFLPNFGPTDASGENAIEVAGPDLKALGLKLIRGICYVTDRIYIEDSHAISVHFVHEEPARPVIQLIEQFGKEYCRGPGVRIQRAAAEDDIHAGALDIELWGVLRMYGIILPKASTDNPRFDN